MNSKNNNNQGASIQQKSKTVILTFDDFIIGRIKSIIINQEKSRCRFIKDGC